MNNIQKSGKNLLYIFYTLLIGILISLLSIFGIIKDLSFLQSIVKINMLLGCLVLLFLYKAAKFLINTEDLENQDEELITTGERMRRMKDSSENYNQ